MRCFIGLATIATVICYVDGESRLIRGAAVLRIQMSLYQYKVYAYLESGCLVRNYERIECGWNGINKDQCLQIYPGQCCWDASDDVIQCYFMCIKTICILYF